jgi:FAD synthase
MTGIRCISFSSSSIPVAPTWKIGIRETLCFTSVFNLRQSVGLLGRDISPSQGLYLTHIQNKQKQTSMSRVGFEPRMPVLERAKTFHILDCAATVIGNQMCRCV